MSDIKSILVKFANTYGVDPNKMLNTLKSTCFKQKDGQVSSEQMIALLIVADQHKLNPFTKEIYAFPDKQNGIVPVVGVDGWSRIINDKPGFNGMEFRQSDAFVTLNGSKPCPEWIECVIYDKQREFPVTAREYLDEVYRPPFKGTGKNGPYEIAGPWQSHTKRMLRHKAMIQCARIAYGFGGIYDHDEAERIIEAEIVRDVPMVESSRHRFKPGEKEEIYTQVKEALVNGDELALKQLTEEYKQDEVVYMKFWTLFNSEERAAIKALEAS